MSLKDMEKGQKRYLIACGIAIIIAILLALMGARVACSHRDHFHNDIIYPEDLLQKEV